MNDKDLSALLLNAKTAKERTDVLMRLAAMLSEHFDSVQIIATCSSGSNTLRAVAGAGNWYARCASVRSWVMEQDAYTTRGAERDADSDLGVFKDDDSDDWKQET